MCGIIGYLAKEPLERRLEDALDLLKPRGPDASAKNTFTTKNQEWHIGLGHTRLSIQDVSADSNQPMISECGAYVIIYNGELYNKEEVIRQYGLLNLRSTSDTEVILEAFVKFGNSVFQSLDGIFAFAIYNRVDDQVTICRDPFGVKPLYLYRDHNQMVFGSEVKALACFVKPEVCEASFVESLRFGFVLEPKTGFSNIMKLDPGHFLEVGFSASLICKKTTYFHRSTPNITQQEFLENMKRQVVSDRPLGLMYSDGCDSNIISELFGDEIKSRLTAVYNKETTCENFGNFPSRRETFNQPENIVEAAKQVVRGLEEPISDFTYIVTSQLSRSFSKAGVRVVFSGMGGDEVFGDYPRDRIMVYHKYRLLLLPPLKIANYLLSLLRSTILAKKRNRLISFLRTSDPLVAYSQLVGYFSIPELKNLLEPKFRRLADIKIPRPNFGKILTSASATADFERLGYLSHNLTVADKAGMANGVEIRVPFLSLKNVNYSNFGGGFGFTRHQLLQCLDEATYQRVASRPKSGFNPPLDDLVTAHGEDFYLQYFRGSKILRFISYEVLTSIIRNHFSRRENETYKIWQLVFLNEWLVEYS